MLDGLDAAGHDLRLIQPDVAQILDIKLDVRTGGAHAREDPALLELRSRESQLVMQDGRRTLQQPAPAGPAASGAAAVLERDAGPQRRIEQGLVRGRGEVPAAAGQDLVD